MILAQQMRACGPVGDRKAAERAYGLLGADPVVAGAWPALAPIFAASPYLTSLARRDPTRLASLLADDPDRRFAELVDRTVQVAVLTPEAAMPALRVLKQEAHLLSALADLGGVWDLDQVTGGLTRFADAALQSALASAAAAELAAGRTTRLGHGPEGPVPGWFCIAMGKQGAYELNYSSDIDVSVFFEPERMPVADGIEPQAFAVRLVQRVSELMQTRTADGYVFRMDLRLRPDPSSTPPAVAAAAALEYYQTVGQNWERAAFIKARPCAGDQVAGAAFLAELQPYIWRRNLDFAAIADIHAIKRQIHVHKVDDRVVAKGVDLKLGRGGIREIEFYVQTQQLILGGRHPGLRSNRTLDALQALADAGHVQRRVADELTAAYIGLRSAEHRVQMIADEQTHRLPESDPDRRRIAALSGHASLRTFDAEITRTLKTVNARFGELFAEEEPLSSRFGSLVFTGVEDDPETLATLARMGFSAPRDIAQTIRNWHHGRAAATGTERGRELFTRLAPRLLDALQATGAPDAAFARFRLFFEGVNGGVQLQSLFLAQPRLFELVVQVLAFAPRLAATLARRPAAIDAMLDPQFFAPLAIAEERIDMQRAVQTAGSFEAAMDAVRRIHRDQAFRVGVQVMSGSASAEVAGRAFADLADVCIEALAPVALADAVRQGGEFAGEVAVVALGKCGSREMSAGSDLDLMTVYRAADPAAASTIKGWDASAFYGRFTQRLIAALSSPTTEGQLYDVDMKLRPSGSKGPVAVSFVAFEDYYRGEAETWEFLALTRARVVWATSAGFAADSQGAIEAALRRPRETDLTARDVRDMRILMEQERPPHGPWDLKLSPGGQVDVEFAVQFLQLIHAASGGPLRPNTAEAIEALSEAGLAADASLTALAGAWRLQQNLTQLLKVAIDGKADPTSEPKAFQALLARAGGVSGFRNLRVRLDAAQRAARTAYLEIVEGGGRGQGPQT